MRILEKKGKGERIRRQSKWDRNGFESEKKKEKRKEKENWAEWKRHCGKKREKKTSIEWKKWTRKKKGDKVKRLPMKQGRRSKRVDGRKRTDGAEMEPTFGGSCVISSELIKILIRFSFFDELEVSIFSIRWKMNFRVEDKPFDLGLTNWFRLKLAYII